MTADGSVENVLLVTVDSLRADAVGAYDELLDGAGDDGRAGADTAPDDGRWLADDAAATDGDDPPCGARGPAAQADVVRHTPVIDGLAERGAVVERAFATGNWTPFSFPGMLASRPTFLDTGRIGVDGAPTLAATVRDAGVATAGFNAANGFLTEHWGYDEGFDDFDAFVADVGGRYSRYLARHPTVEAWIQLATSPFRRAAAKLRGGADDRPFFDASRMFDVEHAARDAIHGADGPFFLWLHYMDAHTPYVPAPRYIREVADDRFGTHRMLHAHVRTGLGWDVGDGTLRDLRTLYQAAVRQVDDSVGRVLDALEAAGVADETAVVLAGDHGEEFQDHGHLAHYPKLYDELIRVPLIVDVPGEEGRRVDGQVGLDAIPPTVAELLGVEPPDAWTGASLAPVVRDGAAPPDDPVVSVTVRGDSVTSQPIPTALDDGDLLVSVRDRDWTYVANVADDAEELYHRPTDAGQHRDLSTATTGEAPAVRERFAAIARDHAEAIRAAAADGEETRDADGGDVDEDVATRLAALGYR